VIFANQKRLWEGSNGSLSIVSFSHKAFHMRVAHIMAMLVTSFSFFQTNFARADEPIGVGSLPKECRIMFYSGQWQADEVNLNRKPRFDDETIHATRADIISCPPISIKFCSAHKCIRSQLSQTSIDLKKFDVMAVSEITSYSDPCTEDCTAKLINLNDIAKEYKNKVLDAIKEGRLTPQ
jgi:hypothetical protein